MSLLYQKIIITLLALIILTIIRQIFVKRVIKRFLLARFSPPRKKMTLKLINGLFILLLVVVLSGVWGLNGAQIVTYLASTLTILGVAFFAQWSLLCNITSGLILFFNHPVKLGDRLSIVDKDTPLEGIVEDIGLFFLTIKNQEDKHFTIPNATVIQKILRIVPKDEPYPTPTVSTDTNPQTDVPS